VACRRLNPSVALRLQSADHKMELDGCPGSKAGSKSGRIPRRQILALTASPGRTHEFVERLKEFVKELEAGAGMARHRLPSTLGARLYWHIC
jgi:hypothetical protein